MTTERWRRIQTVFLAVVELPSADRPAALDAACAGDADLRAQVEALLEADAAPPLLLEPEWAGHVGRWAAFLDETNEDADPEAPVEGRRVGPYRLVREIGRGGMGRVYLAERDDGRFRRRVALKLLHPGLAPELAGRFRAERQILASLEHPHIARLYDAGLAQDGRPYLALEHVEGRPLDRYADEEGLGVEERLRLFVQVGEAVRYAHGRLVVHRDLKPSNILVDVEGQVKLLDFGIAKLLDPDPSGLLGSAEAEGFSQPAVRTQTGMRPMTRAYAAPEQIRGEAVTTATDVYALGVVLYELLTGRRPFEAASAHALERAILETDPDAPSTAAQESSTTAGTPSGAASASAPRDRTDPAGWARTLRGDLDVVCLTALRKEPTARYGSAEAFVADVQRYLDGLPIAARPPTAAYRLGKFARRHRVAVAAAALVCVLVLAFAGAMAVQSARVTQQRDRAEEALAQAEEVSDFLIGLFEASNPAEEQEQLSAVDLLERGAARAEELTGQPAVQAQMHAAVGRAFLSLGRYDRAEPLLERALALRRQHYGARHEAVAQSLGDLAHLHVEQRGDYDAAEPLYQEMLTIYREGYGPDHPKVPSTLMAFGTLLFYRGAFDEAAGRFEEALAMLRERPAAAPGDLAAALNNLALTRIRLGQPEQAEPLLRESLAFNRAEYGDAHPTVATNLNILADALHAQEKYEEAEALLLDVLARRRALFGGEHQSVAAVLNNLAQVVRAQGRPADAIRYAREALAIQRTAQGPEHPLLALSLKNLGHLLLLQGAYPEAEAVLHESLAIFRGRFGEEHRQVTLVRERLRELYAAWGKPAEEASVTSAAEGGE